MSRINDIKGEKVHTRWQNSLIYIGICAIFICCTTPDAMANGVSSSCDNEHYYLSQCGSTVIGTNMLKGFVGDDAPDYYDYQDPANNLVNLRILFKRSSTDPIIYRDKDNVQHIVGYEEHRSRREKILLHACNPNETEIICLPCPDGGKSFPSHVAIGTTTANISDWYTPTFADCYKDKLNDTTGTYRYVTSPDSTNRCYYNTDIPGTTIYNSSNAVSGGIGGDAD